MTMTETELRALGYVAKDGKAVRINGSSTHAEAQAISAATNPPGPIGSARAADAIAPRSPYRSKTEALYEARLRAMLFSGDICAYRYEAVTLRLGDRVRFTPDFRVVLADGTVELHEVKGAYTREDARIKLQTAATLFPEYVFRLAVSAKGQWTISTVRAV